MERVIVPLKPLNLVWHHQKEPGNVSAAIHRDPRFACQNAFHNHPRDCSSPPLGVKQERDFRSYFNKHTEDYWRVIYYGKAQIHSSHNPIRKS